MAERGLETDAGLPERPDEDARNLRIDDKFERAMARFRTKLDLISGE